MSFNFMATGTIHSAFGVQENKACHFFHFPPSICHEVMGPGAMILVFWMSSFKLYQDSLVPLDFLPLKWYHLQVWGCWYFSWQSWFQLVTHPAWHFFHLISYVPCTGRQVLYHYLLGASLVAQSVAPAMQETQVQSLGQEDPLEKEMATHSSILAWRTPWTEEPGGLHTVHGVARVRHDWATKPPHHTTTYKALGGVCIWEWKILPAISVNKGCCSPQAITL